MTKSISDCNSADNSPWDKIISRGLIKELLLGKEKEYFIPEDGKSAGAIAYYRWYHDRVFVVHRILDYYTNGEKFNDLISTLSSALNALEKEDIFVCLQSVRSFFFVLSFSDDGWGAYKHLQKILKQKYHAIRDNPNLLESIPEDFPGDIEKLLSSFDKYISKLDARH